MARKLPWSESATNTKISTSNRSSAHARPAKRVKVEDQDQTHAGPHGSASLSSNSSKRDGSASVPSDRRHQDRYRSRNGRSPSTSPPPAPPPVALMRPGLDEDDIYMLVEDEFQAVAQSYTAHLHHAEYKRLMRLAREKKAAEQKKTFGGGLRKIPDDVTPETRQKLRRELLQQRQSSGVKSMLEGAGGGGLLDGSEDEDDEEEAKEAVLTREEKKVGDMWAGTALGGLMSWDHSQEKTSLKGLERIGGETRASRGYGPNERSAVPLDQRPGKGPGKEQKSITGRQHRDDAANAGRLTRTIRDKGPAEPAMYLTEDVKFKSTAKPTREPDPTLKPARFSRDPPQASPVKFKCEPVKSTPKTTAAGGGSRSRHRTLIDSLDDFDDASFEATQAAATSGSNSPEKKLSPAQTRAKEKEKQKRDRKDRLDEVPVFLF